MLSIGVNVYGYCKNIPPFFDVALITLQHDKYPFFCVKVCSIYYKVCPNFFIYTLRGHKLRFCLARFSHRVHREKMSFYRSFLKNLSALCD